MRDILYPKEIKFKFYEDGMKFVAIMASIAVLGFCCICPILVIKGEDARTFIDRSLNLIVIAVPPALPAAMSCGMVFAIQRLKKSKIFCISPPRVNVAGSVTSFVFDKTGTLTEDGLSVQGFRCTQNTKTGTVFKEFSRDPSEFYPIVTNWWDTKNAVEYRNSNSTLLMEALACCCAVTYVNGSLIGDPLDVKMFLSTKWVLDEESGR